MAPNSPFSRHLHGGLMNDPTLAALQTEAALFHAAACVRDGCLVRPDADAFVSRRFVPHASRVSFHDARINSPDQCRNLPNQLMSQLCLNSFPSILIPTRM